MIETGQAIMTLEGQLKKPSEEASVQWVWVPTEQVLFLAAQVPGKRASDWMQALPYVLEERLAQPVESLHFAVLHRQNSGEKAGWTQVAVVEKARMQLWLDELAAQGLSGAELIPDCFRVPVSGKATENPENDQAWQVWSQDENRRLVRTGAFSGLAGEPEWLEQVWALAKESNPDLQQETLTSLPSLNFASVKPLSLRQGSFRAASDKGRVWQAWKWPMILSLAIFIVALLNTMLTTQRVEQQAEAYEKQTLALFKQLFPDVKRVVNIRAQTKARLSQADNDDDNAHLGSLLKTLEVAIKPLLDKKVIQLQGLRWQNRELQLNVSAKQSGVLQQLADDLQKHFPAEFKLSHAAPNLTEGVIYVRAR